MEQAVKSFFEKINGKKIALCGIGRSNLPLAKLFTKYGAKVTMCDKRDISCFNDVADELINDEIMLRCGEDYLNGLETDILFRTPGMYYNMPKLFEFRKKGVVVTSEMEVFFDICPCKIYAITGTDGKTTTTTVVSNILKAAGKTVHLGGNIGKPLLPNIENIKCDDIAVVELSSFQLISMRRSPDVAAVTNIYPDHLNVHKDMDEYIGAKKNILIHQNAFSRSVLNMDNPDTNALQDIVRGDLYKFSRINKVEKGAYLDKDGWLTFTDGTTDEKIVHKDDIKIPGLHNVENYLCAICMVHGEVENSIIANVAKTFGGVEHRIEFVRELNGVRYYNDSIATSPASVTAGLRAFGKKIIMIAGGSDKGLDYAELAKEIVKYVKVLILLGQTADKIETAVKSTGDYADSNINIIRVKTMEDAVAMAKTSAVSGDVVSLSPASASFDMYKDFEDRGRHYKSIVTELK